jgi:hypothetical protein
VVDFCVPSPRRPFGDRSRGSAWLEPLERGRPLRTDVASKDTLDLVAGVRPPYRAPEPYTGIRTAAEGSER